jgi:hypothetical protein
MGANHVSLKSLSMQGPDGCDCTFSEARLTNFRSSPCRWKIEMAGASSTWGQRTRQLVFTWTAARWWQATSVGQGQRRPKVWARTENCRLPSVDREFNFFAYIINIGVLLGTIIYNKQTVPNSTIRTVGMTLFAQLWIQSFPCQQEKFQKSLIVCK